MSVGNQVISGVPKETEVEVTTDNEMIEKNVELINTGTSEARTQY
jgi:hypothetical protein